MSVLISKSQNNNVRASLNNKKCIENDSGIFRRKLEFHKKQDFRTIEPRGLGAKLNLHLTLKLIVQA